MTVSQTQMLKAALMFRKRHTVFRETFYKLLFYIKEEVFSIVKIAHFNLQIIVISKHMSPSRQFFWDVTFFF